MPPASRWASTASAWRWIWTSLRRSWCSSGCRTTTATSGGDYGKQPDKLGAGAAAGVRVEPMAFLVVKDGVTRMLPVGTPAITTVDRIVEMVPQVMDRVEGFIDKKREKADF